MDAAQEKEYKKNVLKLALFVGELMIKNGAETSRVEDSVLRICRSQGFHHANVFTTPTVVIISDEKFDGFCFMKTIDKRGINLNKISLLNNFSREFCSIKNPDIDKAIAELYEIDRTPPYPSWFFYSCTGLASACFAYIIGGNQLLNFIFTFIVAIIGDIIYDKIMKISSISAFSCVVSSFAITVLGVIFTELKIISTPTMLIVGSIMPLLPGVAVIKSIRDLIAGNLISGISRIFDAFMVLLAIASGVGVVLDLWLKMGGVL
ncbi:threonine/serine exporter [Peptacetobacter hominis]|uniref:Threonine/serine exporter n=1 Tax=Peptacetobacter hominis TaxID=2743610 RepID=A0A544QTF8_9FIRM|nr:threonine/serine exporter family protein [Peptacetobacter hominis]TQQ83973.1 threonine/serine exporter [Peptacetobacter hominis]